VLRHRLRVARARRRLQALPRLSRRVDRADSSRRTTAEVASVWPKAQEFGFPNEEAAFALQMGHGIGLAIWEKPMISRLVSLEHPHEIKPGMVFALETFWPSTDGWSAARIEEEIVVTETGTR
jgi:Xaa-Pro aminopeptidase